MSRPRTLVALVLLAAACSGAPPTGSPTRSAAPTSTPTSVASTAGTAPSASPAGNNAEYDVLLTQIPAAIAATCVELDPTPAAALAIARCQPLDLVGSTGDITYVRYADGDGLFDLLGAKLIEVGDLPTSSDPQRCAAGPILTGYAPAGFVEGRLICAPGPGSGGELIAWWFDIRTNSIGSLLLSEGAYQDLYDAVLAAALEP